MELARPSPKVARTHGEGAPWPGRRRIMFQRQHKSKPFVRSVGRFGMPRFAAAYHRQWRAVLAKNFARYETNYEQKGNGTARLKLLKIAKEQTKVYK